MSTETDRGRDAEPDQDPLDLIREHEEDVEALAELTDQVGAFARILLAEARGEEPAEEDIRAAGLDDDARRLLGGSQ